MAEETNLFEISPITQTSHEESRGVRKGDLAVHDWLSTNRFQRQ